MPRASSSRSRGGKKQCPICEGSFSPQTFAAHSRKCEREKKVEEESMKSSRELRRRPVAQVAYTRARASAPSDGVTSTRDGFGASHLQDLHLPLEKEAKASHPNARSSTNMITDDATTTSATRAGHRSTRKGRKGVKKIRHFEASNEDARDSKPQRSSGRASASDIEPWSEDFKTYEDYLLAKIIHEWNVSKQESNRLIDLLHRCSTGHGSITLSSFFHADGAWEGYIMFRDDSDY